MKKLFCLPEDNRSRSVESQEIRSLILGIVNKSSTFPQGIRKGAG